uniref:ATP synthase subunit a n=1 Tax=Hypsicera sp. ZJUH_2016019 TaxID=2491161 RepID=A0A3S8V0V0_9HYME|nr:ATP synthase F0 subunit 6 [Hypsicera sp. ZJUH_2016019]
MMSNLFSIFDSSTSHIFELNWLSSISNFIFMPLTFWILKSRILKILDIILLTLHFEFKTILFLKFNYLNSIYFISLFLLILLNNFLGLYPYIFTSSSHLIFAISFSMPLWLSLMIFSWFMNTNFMFSHMIPQSTPNLLMPFMVLIETVSNFIRPATLAIRLTANMIAGHLLVTLLSESANTSISFISLFIINIQIILLLLEFSVSIIQSYVFSILSILYTKETNYNLNKLKIHPF